MPNLNRVSLMGNLTRDPEIKYTPKGIAVTDLAMAINRNYTLESGEKKQDVVYVDVTLYGRQAEIAKEFPAKGKPVFIEGRLSLDSWEDKATGQRRSKLKVVGEGLQLLGARDRENQDAGESNETHSTETGPQQSGQRPAGGDQRQPKPQEARQPRSVTPPEGDEVDEIPS